MSFSVRSFKTNDQDEEPMFDCAVPSCPVSFQIAAANSPIIVELRAHYEEYLKKLGLSFIFGKYCHDCTHRLIEARKKQIFDQVSQTRTHKI